MSSAHIDTSIILLFIFISFILPSFLSIFVVLRTLEMPPRKKAAANEDDSPKVRRTKATSAAGVKKTRKTKKRDEGSEDSGEEEELFIAPENLEPEVVLKRVRELTAQERQKNSSKTYVIIWKIPSAHQCFISARCRYRSISHL